MWVPTNSGNRSESCSENSGFRIAQVVRCHSENGISHSENYFLNSESCSENAPELSESSENGLFTPRAFSLKFCYGGPKPQKSPRWLGEGAKGLLGQGRQSPLALVQKRVAPVQNRALVVQKTLGRPLLPGSKTPFAPSPNHFGHF